MENNTTFSDMAIEILRATHDGDRLASSDLGLVELAVNGFLNEEGKSAFQQLHQNATKPDGYTPPNFLGIEHLTRDHAGYVLWKGTVVEHFDHDVWRQSGWQERIKTDAENVAIRCRELEARGIQPTLDTVLNFDPNEIKLTCHRETFGV